MSLVTRIRQRSKLSTDLSAGSLSGLERALHRVVEILESDRPSRTRATLQTRLARPLSTDLAGAAEPLMAMAASSGTPTRIKQIIADHPRLMNAFAQQLQHHPRLAGLIATEHNGSALLTGLQEATTVQIFPDVSTAAHAILLHAHENPGFVSRVMERTVDDLGDDVHELASSLGLDLRELTSRRIAELSTPDVEHETYLQLGILWRQRHDSTTRALVESVNEVLRELFPGVSIGNSVEVAMGSLNRNGVFDPITEIETAAEARGNVNGWVVSSESIEPLTTKLAGVAEPQL